MESWGWIGQYDPYMAVLETLTFSRIISSPSWPGPRLVISPWPQFTTPPLSNNSSPCNVSTVKWNSKLPIPYYIYKLPQVLLSKLPQVLLSKLPQVLRLQTPYKYYSYKLPQGQSPSSATGSSKVANSLKVSHPRVLQEAARCKLPLVLQLQTPSRSVTPECYRKQQGCILQTTYPLLLLQTTTNSKPPQTPNHHKLQTTTNSKPPEHSLFTRPGSRTFLNAIWNILSSYFKSTLQVELYPTYLVLLWLSTLHDRLPTTVYPTGRALSYLPGPTLTVYPTRSSTYYSLPYRSSSILLTWSYSDCLPYTIVYLLQSTLQVETILLTW